MAQALDIPVRLLGAPTGGLNDDIDARSRIAKAIECLLSGGCRLIVGLIRNREHNAIDGGVALWDVIESCDIKGSSDASIRNVVPAHIELITSNVSIEQVICNGGTAGRLSKRYLQERTGLPAVILPSTSPANAAWRLERLVECWREAVDWGAR